LREENKQPGGSDPFPPEDFDDWAATYDEVVAASSAFPFDGYDRVLDRIAALAACHPGQSVLDLGAGTGNLLARFSPCGAELWGSDFSPEMLKQARRKLPAVTWVQADLRAGWPVELDRRFDRIISAYTFHHFELAFKVDLCVRLVRSRLAPLGRLVIGDISFPTRPALVEARQALGNEWDEEYYWIADEAMAALRQAGLTAGYDQVSSCAGVYWLQMEPDGSPRG
jgi:putative AdoMet-dependent methyltransferase